MLESSLARWGCSLDLLGYSLDLLDCSLVRLGCSQGRSGYIVETSGCSQGRMVKPSLGLWVRMSDSRASNLVTIPLLLERECRATLLGFQVNQAEGSKQASIQGTGHWRHSDQRERIPVHLESCRCPCQATRQTHTPGWPPPPTGSCPGSSTTMSEMRPNRRTFPRRRPP